MYFKTFCLLLVLVVAAFALPQNYDHGEFADDIGFGNGQGQGGFPTVNHDHDVGFGNGHGHGGIPEYRHRHRGGYQEFGY